ncbi:MAG TPA: CvpA family protein [Anaerolineaceae bacterium]|nr:CvpA family protein [Anaerolineaceae bacterium]HQN05251.1 CvpA family protein [Anaerolineaceae bacterium]HQP07920.1 CvpA family protein [Anaerolineaceae bacterium]
MISLHVLFWVFIILFAVIGITRGWAKELLVLFSIILGLFLLGVLEKYVPYVRDDLMTQSGDTVFWLRFGVIVVLVFFGYETPNLPRLAESPKFMREKFQDSLLGFFLGAINGFMIFGTLWYFLDAAGYPFDVITAPVAGTAAGDAALKLLAILPPEFLSIPVIYFAVAICFAFVLVVFI